MSDYNIQGMNFYGDNTLEDIVLDNIKEYFRYGLLEVGAYINIDKDQTDRNGNDISRLFPVSNRPGVTDGTIYKSRKDDWVWESNITLKASGGSEPYVPSGIYVNNVFYATGTDVSGIGYILDFRQGRVVFDSALPSGSIVQCPHTERYVSVYDSDSYEGRELVRQWQDVATNSSGTIDSFGAKAYMPCIILELANYRTIKGLQIGSRAKVVNANLELNIFADSPANRKRLTDICYLLENQAFNLFDVNTIPSPLNNNGELINPDSDWKTLSTDYRIDQDIARFAQNARVQKIRSGIVPIFRSRVRISLEIDVAPR